ncbi:MAG: hypothetical protein VKS61_01770 [Candidatus Sericytochromatia bacterium]|nr:hypothetical protein [Candidatus Sericytochromatia bacterium]
MQLSWARRPRSLVAPLALLAAAACGPAPAPAPTAALEPAALASPSASPLARPSGAPGVRVPASAPPRAAVAILEGRVFGPAALANGAPVIVGERFDLSEPSPAARLRLLQATFEKPVQNALVAPRGPDLKLVSATLGTYSDAEGRFRLPGVSTLACVFLEVRTRAAGRNVRALAWARPREALQAGGVPVDLASTLVARELLRFWQRAGRNITFAQLATADVEPLLLRVRRALSGGLPAGLSFDPGSVQLPTEAWSAEADAADGALVLLDGLAKQDPLIEREVDRLWLGCNAVVTGRRDPDRPVVFRPGREPAPTPSVAPSATPTASSTVSPSSTPSAPGTVQPGT